MTLEGLKDYTRDEYGRRGADELPARLERVEYTGCSAYGVTAADVLVQNRAGENGKRLTPDELWAKYAHAPLEGV